MTARALAAWVLLGALGIAAAGPARAAPPAGHPEHRWLSYAADPAAEPALDELALEPARERELAGAGRGYVEQLLRRELHLQGEGEHWYRMVQARRYLAPSGVQEAGNLSFAVAVERQSAVIEAAYVLAPDGARRPVDLGTIQVQSRERGVFSDVREVIVPFSGLEPGAVAVLVSRVRESTRRWPLPWAQVMYLQSAVPIESFEVSVQWAADAPEPALAQSDPALQCSSERPRARVCRKRRVPALELDPDVRSYYDLAPRLVISVPHGWGELAQRELALVQAAAVDDPALEREAVRLTADAQTAQQKLAALQRFVADEIRYVGLEHGEFAVNPRPAALTLQRRFGDCKDKVVLFLALARHAGLQAHATLVATDLFAPDQLPAPAASYFDHMIACVRGETGAQCIDLTDPHAPSGELTGELAGAVALDLVAGAEPRALPEPPFALKVELHSRNAVGCAGDIEETLERRHGGLYASGLRRLLRPMPGAERQRWLAQNYADVMGERVQPELELLELEGGSQQVAIRSRTRFPAGTPLREVRAYSEPDAWLASYALGLRSQNRHHPYLVAGLQLQSSTEYELCAEAALGSLGPVLALRHEFGSLERSYEPLERGVRVTTRLAIPRRTLAAADVPRFNRFIDALIEHAGLRFGLRPAGGS